MACNALAAARTSWMRPSASSAPSVFQAKVNSANALAAQGLRTVGGSADGSRGTNGRIVRAKYLKIKDKTDADGADADRSRVRRGARGYGGHLPQLLVSGRFPPPVQPNKM